MSTSTPPNQTAQDLNARRRKAVQLRLDGSTLADVQNAVGLSAPTIIAATKAYQSGGWDAVHVAARGRPRRTAQQTDQTTEQLHSLLLTHTTLSNSATGNSTSNNSATLMNIDQLALWLQTHDHPLSRSAQQTLLNKWDLQPENHYKQLRSSAQRLQSEDEQHQSQKNPLKQPLRRPILPEITQSAQSVRWLEHHNRFADRARRRGAAVLWLASRPVLTGQTQLYAHDLRGRSHWCLVEGQASSQHYHRFLKALDTHLEQPLALVFSNSQLPRITELAQWLATTHTQFICVDESSNAPTFNPSPGLTMTSTTDAAPVARQPDTPSDTLTHLQRLEAESIHIMREVAAEAENPVMLYSVGKDSAVMLHLALKAFYPAVPPFPLLHVDTTWKFKQMYEFREKIVEKYGLELLRHVNPEGLAQNVNPFTHGSSLHTDIMKTQGLKQALNEHKFDFAFGGARRDEEKSRAKERVFSFRNAQHSWDAKNQRPELWKLYNARKQRDESIRVFPLSNWTELDIWQYIHKEDIPIVPLYLAAKRPVVERDGMLIMVDDERMPLNEGEVPEMRSVRFRTLGCYPLTGAVESTATTLEEIIQEMLLTRTSERQGRMIDHDSAASMEKKKQEGYF